MEWDDGLAKAIAAAGGAGNSLKVSASLRRQYMDGAASPPSVSRP